MYFAVFVTHKPGMSQTRSDLYDAFAAYLRDHPGHPDVTYHHGGPTIADNGEDVDGLLLAIEAPSIEAARSFLGDSPYAKAGLFAESQVRRWDWTTGRPA